MPVQLGAKPQAGFDQPVGLLMDCHRRIERFLDILRRVAERAAGGPLDGEHRVALDTALNYFRFAAPRHTEDEEHSLFPRMRRSDDPAVREALTKMDALEADHRAQEADHARVDELGRRWLADDRLDGAGVDELRGLLARLQAGYQRHIRIEDEELFPLANRLLNGAQLTDIGREMERRRQGGPNRAATRPDHPTGAADHDQRIPGPSANPAAGSV